jgi:hypothetical protein
MLKHGNPTQDQDLFFGNYRAIVVDNIELDDDGNPVKSGRVKVRVPSIHGDNVPDEALPWAIYSDPFMGGLEDVGGFLVPNKDAKVWVFFEEGDHEQPVYFAGAPSKPHMPAEKDVEDYPNNKVFKTKAGFVIEIDDSEEDTRLRVYQPSGNEKVSDHEGNVEETIVGNVNRTIAGTLTVDIEGKTIFKAPEMQFGEDDKVEQSVLGKQLEDWINTHLLPWLNEHNHTGNLGSPTSVPITPFQAGAAEPEGGVWSKVNTNQ